MMVSLSMLVPDSLDYALAMGHSATASGVFLSAPFVLAMLGTILGRPLTSEVKWDQRFARYLCVGCQGVTVAGSLTLAFLMQAASHWSDATKQTSFWCFLFVSGASQFFNAFPVVAWTTMWNVVTPNSQKTIWSMITIACRHCGMVFGPVAFAALSFSVRRGRDISPISMMGWSYVGLATFQALAPRTQGGPGPGVVSALGFCLGVLLGLFLHRHGTHLVLYAVVLSPGTDNRVPLLADGGVSSDGRSESCA